MVKLAAGKDEGETSISITKGRDASNQIHGINKTELLDLNDPVRDPLRIQNTEFDPS
jgi:hypothetical protein